MKQINQDFLDFLKDGCKKNLFKNEALTYSYLHCFSIYFEMNPDDNILKHLKKEINENELWFTHFHKSLRQTDFFYSGGEIYLEHRHVFSKEDREIYDKLIKEALSDNKNSDIEKNKKKRREIVKKYKHKKSLNICGHLDMMLYEMINFDNNNVLYNLFLKFFKKNTQ